MAESLPHAGERLGPLEIAVTRARVHAYADASADHNPIHVDDAFAASTAFGGPIAHGMLLLAYLSRLVSDRFGRAWLESGTLDARFRAPAMVGSTIVVEGSVESVGPDGDGHTITCSLRCTDSAGQALITAVARLRLG